MVAIEPVSVAFERPLSARSVMASLLLGRNPPAARGRDLVRWCALFGVSEGTARVALHRMVARGELDRRDDRYHLAGRLERRRGEQQASLSPDAPGSAWGGEWHMALLSSARAAARDRGRRRDLLRRAHFAELREGLWARPANCDPPTVAGVDWWTARPGGDPAALAERLFRLAAWARRATQIRRTLAQVNAELEEGDAGLVADAFVAGAAALRHVRADPLVPAVLLPDAWPADELREDYATFQRAFNHAAAAWFRGG
jgi:phenylacetic acid degradation operon negative regulatory protein